MQQLFIFLQQSQQKRCSFFSLHLTQQKKQHSQQKQKGHKFSTFLLQKLQIKLQIIALTQFLSDYSLILNLKKFYKNIEK